jgi:hypothetical protein
MSCAVIEPEKRVTVGKKPSSRLSPASQLILEGGSRIGEFGLLALASNCRRTARVQQPAVAILNEMGGRRWCRRLLIQNEQETMMTKLVLALALAFATLAAVPASAGPYCQEDLGYGRTSSFGCGG